MHVASLSPEELEQAFHSGDFREPVLAVLLSRSFDTKSLEQVAANFDTIDRSIRGLMAIVLLTDNPDHLLVAGQGGAPKAICGRFLSGNDTGHRLLRDVAHARRLVNHNDYLFKELASAGVRASQDFPSFFGVSRSELPGLLIFFRGVRDVYFASLDGFDEPSFQAVLLEVSSRLAEMTRLQTLGVDRLKWRSIASEYEAVMAELRAKRDKVLAIADALKVRYRFQSDNWQPVLLSAFASKDDIDPGSLLGALDVPPELSARFVRDQRLQKGQTLARRCIEIRTRPDDDAIVAAMREYISRYPSFRQDFCDTLAERQPNLRRVGFDAEIDRLANRLTAIDLVTKAVRGLAGLP